MREVGRILCLLPLGSVYAVSHLGPRYLFGEKIMISVFSASVWRPFVSSHRRDCSSFEMAFSHALLGVAEIARIAPSSTYKESAECVHVELRERRNEV